MFIYKITTTKKYSSVHIIQSKDTIFLCRTNDIGIAIDGAVTQV